MNERLRGQFNASQGLDGVALNRIDCRTAMCRIDLTYRNAATGQKLQERMMFRGVFVEQCVMTSPGVAARFMTPDYQGKIDQSIYLVCRRS